MKGEMFPAVLAFFLSLGLVGGASLADDSSTADLFRSPSDALTSTQYASDCGGFKEDLAQNMPPVENQMQSPWCTTFVAKGLLDYLHHVNTAGDRYKNRISAFDLNSWDASSPQDARGVIPIFNGAQYVQNILDGARDPGELYLDRDFPFDQKYFDPKGVLARLSAYYDTQTSPDKSSCGKPGKDQLDLEKRFVSLPQDVDESEDRGAFLLTMEKKYGLVAHAKPRAKRVRFTPSFSVHHSEPPTGDGFIESVRENLAKKLPMAVSVCANQLGQLPEIGDPVPPALQNRCGGHSMIIMGMELRDGKCELHLRNSWGKGWPGIFGNGNAWIPVQSLLKVLLTHDYNGSPRADLISISKSDAKQEE